MSDESRPEHAAPLEHEIETTEPASDDAILYQATVFHQGYGNGGGLWFNANQSLAPLGDWKGDTAVSSSSCLGSPSVVGLTVFSRGFSWISGGNTLCMNVYNQGTGSWSNRSWMVGIGASPSAVYFKGLIYIFAQIPSANAAPTLNYMTYDGTNLAGPYAVNPGGSREKYTISLQNSPCAFNWGGLLYVFYQPSLDTQFGNQIWYTIFDGTSWGSARPVPSVAGIDSTGSPGCAAAAMGPSGPAALFVFYKGGNGALTYNVLASSGWLPDATVPDTGITDTPNPISMWGKLYVFHQGDNFNGQLWYNVLPPGGAWQGDRRVPDTGMSASPCANQVYPLRITASGSCNDDIVTEAIQYPQLR